MDKSTIKRIVPILLIIITAILIVSTFFNSNNAIIGKWKCEKQGDNSKVFEFYKNGTAVTYNVAGTEVWDSQTYNYIFNDNILTLTWISTRTYPCEVSGNKLLLGEDLFYRVGIGYIPWTSYTIAALCLAGSFIMKKRFEK